MRATPATCFLASKFTPNHARIHRDDFLDSKAAGLSYFLVAPIRHTLDYEFSPGAVVRKHRTPIPYPQPKDASAPPERFHVARARVGEAL